jgi:hypothetical protein
MQQRELLRSDQIHAQGHQPAGLYLEDRRGKGAAAPPRHVFGGGADDERHAVRDLDHWPISGGVCLHPVR